ncbi:MAG: glycosyltransferase family 4 protein [Pseudomonadota bacterium]
MNKKRTIKKDAPKMRSKKLRIAHVHWGFPPIIGGVETHLVAMLPTFVNMGHKASLLTGSADGYLDKYEFEEVKIRRNTLMDLNWLFKRGLAGLDEEIHRLFTSYVEEMKPDILHAHNMHYFSKPHAEILANIATKKGIPLVLTAHNVWEENLFLDLTKDIHWDYIIAVSHYIKREILVVGVNAKNCSVIHHGIDHTKFHPRTSTKDTYKKYPQLKGRQVVFHPARMGIAKGCDVSIKAFNIIHRRFPEAILVLAGTKNTIDWGAVQQKDIAYFLRLIKFFGLEKNVLVDAYRLDQMPGLYAASDVIIYPSTAMEPFGLTMLEAMSTAKPIIVTCAGGMPEIIQDGINGFIVPIKDFESLAGRICRLLAEDRLCDDFGRTGRQMVEHQFTKEIMTEQHIEIYEQLLR